MKNASIIIFCLSVISFVAIIIFEQTLPPPMSGSILSSDNKVIILSIEKFYELTELLISWAMGLFVAMVLLIKSPLESNDKAEVRNTLAHIFPSTVVAVISIYLGHLVFERLTISLRMQLNPLNDPILQQLSTYQYIALVLALISFATGLWLKLSKKA